MRVIRLDTIGIIAIATSTIGTCRQHCQEVSISQISDCGSISFGRYAADTLAWEKYSVFSHNRRQEELEKFKAPGLVAQKKAYFEEYYKKIRDMKGLQAEQETPQTYPNEDGKEGTAQEENGIDAEASEEESKPRNTSQEANGADIHRSKEENKPSSVYKIQILDNHTTANNPSTRGINGGAEEESFFKGNSGRASKEDGTGVCLSGRIAKHSVEGGSSACTPSVKSSSKTTQKGGPVSNEVKRSGSQLVKKQAFTMREKGNVASAVNRTKLDCRISKDVVKPSEKPKSSVCREITSKADVSLVSGKRTTSKTASKIKSEQVQSHSQNRDVQSSSMVCRGSLKKEKMVSRSSNIRDGPLKTHSTPKSLADRLPATSSVLTRSAQVDHLKLTSISSTNIRFKNLPDRNKSNQNNGLECGPISSVKGQRQKKMMRFSVEDTENDANRLKVAHGVDEIDAGLGPKPDSSKGTSIQKASILKPTRKIATSRSVDLTFDRRDSRSKTMPSCRQRMPIWR
ncbi:unnamed protein product [Dovyalis caffra]|uniref:TPX2 C-terminal domain-containing protein n=1 Tax=Dovyalis caffra TaxID=77055 RepID=A0AAV1R1I6_9ROSI|nr:unnamed protein product [Dovyalis caffra]